MSQRDGGRRTEAVTELFEVLMGDEGVTGVVLVSAEGAVLSEAGAGFPLPGDDDPWAALARALPGTREAELVFEHRRLYVRRVDPGYLIVVMAASASAAMVRLQCDARAPSIRKAAGGGGLSRLFRRGSR